MLDSSNTERKKKIKKKHTLNSLFSSLGQLHLFEK